MKRMLLIVWLACVICITSVRGAASVPPPNILIILTDDQGRGDYSAFGTPDIHTPNIDRIFHEGMTFNNFYANSCVCSPSRAALMTGCYPDRVGVPGVIREEDPEDSWGYLSQKAVLLPTLLKLAGYHSALVGKWHLGISSPNTPTERGFDQFDGFLGDMMDDYWTHLRHGQNFMRHNLETVQPDGHATDVFTHWAIRYLESRATPEHRQQPFFLYLAYNAPHDPVQPKPDWLQKVKLREPKMPEKRQRLVALIEHLDDGIGQVLSTLDKLKLTDNTLVVFMSDNGGVLANGANNGPWRGGKTHMYEGGLRVPCAARWPAQIKPGSQSDRNALTMDWFPTALSAAGVAIPIGIDGATLLPTLRSEPDVDPRSHFYFIRREGGVTFAGKTQDAIRKGDWKLLQDDPFAPRELYDLKDDPKETNNLAKEKTNIVRDLDADLRRQTQQGGAVPWQKSAE